MANYPPLSPRAAENAAAQQRQAGHVETRAGEVVYLDGWDKLVLGGHRFPGRARVSRGSLMLKLDDKSKAGANGANITVHGLDPQRFEIVVEVWNDQQLERLHEILKAILPKQGDTGQYPLQLDHPSVRHFGNVSVQILGATTIDPGDSSWRRITIYAKHFMPAKKGKKPATNTPTRSVKNEREARARKNNPPNPAPTEQAGFSSPDLTYTPSR